MNPPKINIKSRLLFGGAWALWGKLVTAFGSIVINILLARILSPGEFGTYILIFSMVAIFSLVAQLGLPQTIIRLISESIALDEKFKARQYIIEVIEIAVLGCFVVGTLMFFYAGPWIAVNVFDDVAIIPVMNFAVVWMVIVVFQQIFVEIYRGFHDIKKASIFSGPITSIVSIFIFTLIWFFVGESNIELIVKLAVAAVLVSVLLSAYKIRSIIIGLPKTKLIRSSIVILSNAWPLWITSITVFIITQADVWIVGYVLDSESVALYGAAAKLAMVMSILSSLLYAVLPPIISAMNVKGELEKLQKLLRASAFVNSIIIFPLFLMFLFWPGYFLGFLFGVYYIEASSVLIFLSIGLLFNVVTGMRGYVLMLTGYGRTQMMISLVGGLINVILCSLGAKIWGIAGVSAGAMIGMVVQCIMEIVVVKLKLGIWTYMSASDFRYYVQEFRRERK